MKFDSGAQLIRRNEKLNWRNGSSGIWNEQENQTKVCLTRVPSSCALIGYRLQPAGPGPAGTWADVFVVTARFFSRDKSSE